MSITGKFVLILLLFIAMNSSISESDGFNFETGKKTVLKLLPGPNNPRNSEGDFIRLINGHILYVYTHYTGESSEDWGTAYLAGRVSTDNGKTWSKESKMVVSQEGDKNVMSVSLFRLPGNSIGLIHLKVDGAFKCTPYMRTSTDEGKTWSKPWKCIPERKGYFQVNNDRIVKLENNRLIMPVVEHDVSGKDWGNLRTIKGIIRLFYSDDNGKNWSSGKSVKYPHDLPYETIMQEPGIVELKNEDILMFARTKSGSQFLSYSKDHGHSWGEAKPGNINSPCSPALIKRIPSTGDLIMVWNNNGKDQQRTPLTVAVSKDEAKTWQHIRNIQDDPQGSFSYPAIHFTDDNHVLVSYCAKGLVATYIDRISLDWIYEEL